MASDGRQVLRDHGLLFIKPKQVLGSLLHFPGRGVYDAEYGLVDVTPEEADRHNRLLDEALVKGLSENCQVGQGGSFYLRKIDGGYQVTTFAGTVVSDRCTVTKTVIRFWVAAKEFRGRVLDDADLFHFKRVA